MRRQSSGMLPISPIGFGESANFPLTGSGKAYAICGTFYTVGCLNVENHHGFTLDGINMNGKAYLEKHKMSCHRLACPVCCVMMLYVGKLRELSLDLRRSI